MIPLLLATALAADPATAEVGAVLDAFHRAAAEADEATYFGLLTDDAVFVGTDATERWDTAAFRAYAAPHFQGETAWTYVPEARQVTLGPGGAVAWFHEALRNPKYGAARGSGVLVATPAGWRIAQYVLSFPVPNAVAADVVGIVQAHEASTGPTAPSAP